MKKDVFSTWLKELASLVFVQSFQAFLLAIILSLVVRLLSNSISETVDTNDVLNSTGVLAVIALASLSKIELLVKNIFGLTSGVADPSLAGGRKALTTGSMLGIMGAKRVLDNGGKIIGGASKALKGRFAIFKAKNDYRQGNLDKGVDDDKGKGQGQKNPLPNGTSEYDGGGNVHNTPGSITRLANEIQALNNTLKNTNLDANKNQKSDKLKELDKAIDDAKKSIHEGHKEMLSGNLETIGAAHGAIAGAVVGAAHGDIGNTAGAAMGVGDKIGESVTNVAMEVHPVTVVKEISRRQSIRKQEKDLNEKLKMLEKNKKNNSNINKDISNE